MIQRKTIVQNGFVGEKPDPAAFLERWRAAIRQMEEKRALALSQTAPAPPFPDLQQKAPVRERRERS